MMKNSDVERIFSGSDTGYVKGKKSLKRTAAVIAVFCILAVTSLGAAGLQEDSAAEDVLEVKMSYNGVADADDNAVHFFAEHFKRLVQEKTDGRVDIILYPNSQLGDEEQRIEQVMSDPMINIASYAGIGTVFPELYAALVPFMFDNYEAGNLFFEESEYWAKSQEAFLSRTGVELLECIEEGGFLAFTNNKRPLHSPEDFSGMKFRAMDDSQVALFRSFGASAVPIPWTELYTALQTGVADGQMNPPMYIIIGSLYEVQDYMTMANIQYSMQYLLVNGAFMESLEPELQSALREAADEAKQLTREDVETRVEERTEFIAEQGVEVYYPSAEEMEQFRDAGQDAFISWLRKRIDQSWVDLALEGAARANAEAQ